uniref:PH domain-containing protein n=1 Tax=Gadus morhua TaxID=8049 RepID=A0A8C5BSI1_GADMO
MSEASNYTGGSDYSTFPASPGPDPTLNTSLNTTLNTTAGSTALTSSSARPSRPSKKIHNFGKRSNSIKRNPNAPTVRSNWLYKQDSTGMKLWKKRWFVLCDMCLFYYRDDKEEGILGSILLPSFHISMLSVDDHISKKYAFKATHPNMRTYYFCTDTAKDMESWMRAMTDAALVHSEPIRRLDKLKLDPRSPPELNHLLNHRSLTRPEVHNNERNREAVVRHHSMSRLEDRKHHPAAGGRDHAAQGGGTNHRSGRAREREYYTLQRDGERFVLQKGGERYALRKDGDGFSLQKDSAPPPATPAPGAATPATPAAPRDLSAAQRGELESYAAQTLDDKYTVAPPPRTPTDGEGYGGPAQDGERYAPAQRQAAERPTPQRDPARGPPREVRRQLSLRETGDRYGTMLGGVHGGGGGVHVVDRYGGLKELKKYATLREGDRYAAAAAYRQADGYATLRDVGGERYGFPRDPGGPERPLTKINSIKLQPAQAAAIAAAVSASRQSQAAAHGHAHTLGHDHAHGHSHTLGHTHSHAHTPCLQVNGPDAPTPGETSDLLSPLEGDGTLGRMQPLLEAEGGPGQEGARGPEGGWGMSRTGSMQQLEHWVRTHNNTPRGPEEDSRSVTSYQTLPRNMPSHRCPPATPRFPEGYRTLPRNSGVRPGSVASAAGSMYERSLDAEKRRSMRDDTMWQLHEWQQRQACSRQSLALPSGAGHYGTLPCTKTMMNISEHAPAPSIPPSPSHGSLYATHSRHHSGGSDTAPPVVRGDGGTLDRRQRAHMAKYGFPVDRRSLPVGQQPQPITAQSLQGKTLNPESYQELPPPPPPPAPHMEDVDIDIKLSRLCEQDKTVRMQEDKLQQLHREKHTLETALLSASQELSEQGSATANPSATVSLLQQRDVLQNGLLSTCRELTRVHTEVERSWRDYDRMEVDVTQAKSTLLEQLEALGSPQTEPPSQRHVEIQKELWRIQDVMEALAKNQPQRSSHPGFPGARPLSSLQKNEQNPDYRLYKSEPELTTVKEEGDEVAGEERDKMDASAERKDAAASRAAPPYPVGIVPPRTKSPMSPPDSLHIGSYVTLRKTKKPEPRSDRPWSSAESPTEREGGRARMSVEEQLERMKRNQQAKRRENPSRSPSFNKDHPLGVLLRRASVEAGSADPGELEAALRQLALSEEGGSVEAGPPAARDPPQPPADQQGELKEGRGEEDTGDKQESPVHEVCDSQKVVIWELCREPQRAEMVKLQAFKEEQRRRVEEEEVQRRREAVEEQQRRRLEEEEQKQREEEQRRRLEEAKGPSPPSESNTTENW